MLQICSTREFNEKFGNKRIICIGAGKQFLRIINKKMWNIEFVIDNDEQKWGKKVESDKRDDILIQNWDFLENSISDDSVLLITPIDYKELVSKVEHTPVLKDIPCFVYQQFALLDYDDAKNWYPKKEIHFEDTKMQIPKIIHFFWFSNDPYPEKMQKCIDSWEKYCPEYEIKKWNLANYDYTVNDYVREAIENKKWQFASDYARADVIYRYGGIYLDTDVEIIKNLDGLLYHQSFIGFDGVTHVDPGSGFGSVKNNPIIREFRDTYSNRHFIKEDGSFDLTPCPMYYTDVLKKKGLVLDGSYQIIEGMAVYPADYFSPFSWQTGITYKKEYTYAIHHYTTTWMSEILYKQYLDNHEFIQRHQVKPVLNG